MVFAQVATRNIDHAKRVVNSNKVISDRAR